MDSAAICTLMTLKFLPWAQVSLLSLWHSLTWLCHRHLKPNICKSNSLLILPLSLIWCSFQFSEWHLQLFKTEPSSTPSTLSPPQAVRSASFASLLNSHIHPSLYLLLSPESGSSLLTLIPAKGFSLAFYGSILFHLCPHYFQNSFVKQKRDYSLPCDFPMAP